MSESRWYLRGREAASALGPFQRRLAIALFVIDAAFVIAHGAYIRGIEPFDGNSDWSLSVDRSYPEMFGYAKLAVAAVLLVMLARRGPKLLYLTWSLVMLIILADDAGRLHEQVGDRIATTFDLSDTLGLRGQDLGELAFWTVAAAVLLGMLAIAHIRTTPEHRRRSAGLFGCVLLLAFFAVFVDMVHILVADRGRVGRIVGMIEDGGELMALSILLVYVVWLRTATLHTATKTRTPLQADGSPGDDVGDNRPDALVRRD